MPLFSPRRPPMGVYKPRPKPEFVTAKAFIHVSKKALSSESIFGAFNRYNTDGLWQAETSTDKVRQALRENDEIDGLDIETENEEE